MSSPFSFSPEQIEVRQELRRFLEERARIEEVRRLMDTPLGYEPAVWQQLCRELGLAGVHIPEVYGGQGFGFCMLAIVLEEMGRSLFSGPYLGSVGIAASAILNSASDTQKKALLPEIASGDCVATLALAEPRTQAAASDRWDSSEVGVCAQPLGDGHYRLDGAKSYVLDGHAADLIVVAGRTSRASERDGVEFFAVRADAEGVSRTPLTTLDPTRRLARLDLRGVRAELLGEPGSGRAAVPKTLAHASIALANEMIGGAQRALEMAVEYAKVRVQFGRPIGSFQAIKHKLADLLLELEPAKSAAYYAAAVAEEDGIELAAVASLAKALAGDAYRLVASENIQIHGGVGFTWEYDAHLYYRRALSCEALLGDSREHRERYLRELER